MYASQNIWETLHTDEGTMYKTREQMGEGDTQMTTMLNDSYLVKVSTYSYYLLVREG